MCLRLFSQFPGRTLVDVFIAEGVEFLDHQQHVTEEQGSVARFGSTGQLSGQFFNPMLQFRQDGLASLGYHTGTGTFNHGERPTQEVADSIRELRVDGRHHRALRKVSVLPEGHFTEQEVAERVDAELLDHPVGIDDVAAALRHFFAVDRPPTVGEDRPRQRQLQRHQHRGPIDRMGRENVLPYQMHVGGPVPVDRGLLQQILQPGDVVHERVEPDIGDVVGVEGKFDTPRKPGFRARD